MKKVWLLILLLWPGLSISQTVRAGCEILNPDAGLNDTLHIVLYVDMREIPAPDSLLGSFTCNIRWDEKVIEYKGDGGFKNSFTGVMNIDSGDSGNLRLAAANPGGKGGNFKIIDLHFLVRKPSKAIDLDVSFDAMAAAHTFQNLMPYLKISKHDD